MTQALLAENLCKKYGRGDTSVTALDHVTISLNTGEVVALLGPSGAGKSTLLTALGLIRPPDSGRIVIDGTTVFDNGYRTDIRAFRRNNLGFVFQKANLLWRTATTRCYRQSSSQPSETPLRRRTNGGIGQCNGTKSHGNDEACRP